MKIIGLAGGIASGKTEVAKVFKKKGALVISGDELGREAVESNPRVLRRLVKTFGTIIIDKQGKLNRRRLAELAFSSRKNRLLLNHIVHPPLLRLLKQRVNKLRSTGFQGVLVIDAALLIQWGVPVRVDRLIVVYAPQKIRIKRLQAQGFSHREIQNRIMAQLPFAVERKFADLVLRNTGSLPQLRAQAKRIWNRLYRAGL